MKLLSIEDVEHVAHILAKKIMEWDEPIPDFVTRYQGKLESCLKTPFQSFAKKDLYPRMEDKAAILFYLMIKNHPFQNGNKRIAVTSLITFLVINQKWLTIPPDELYDLSIWVAESRPLAKDGTVKAITDYVKKHIVEIQNNPFSNGQILFAENINNIFKSIQAIERLFNISTTNFPVLNNGDILTAEHLNLTMTAIDKLYEAMQLKKRNWVHMPVKKYDRLKSETLNEIWNAIVNSVDCLQKKLLNTKK